MLPSDCLSADLHFALQLIGSRAPVAALPPGGRRLSPVLTPALSPFRAPYARGFVDAASPGASRRPWPSPVFARLGSPLVPLRGLPCRRGRLHLTLQTGELLDPLKGLCHGASPVGFRLAAAVSYRAAWSLPGPDSHRLVSVSLREFARFSDPPPSSGVPLLGTPKPGQLQRSLQTRLPELCGAASVDLSM